MEAGRLLPDLEKEDFRILMAIEQGMKKSEYVKVSDIRFYSRYPMEETLYRLKKVHKIGLTIRNAAQYVVSYKLNSIGYDVLALHTLVEKEIISQLGPLLGKGKESDVYSCMDDEENIFALKIYRMGRTSFRNIKRYRNIIGNRTHLSWLYVNRLAAKREYNALSKIYDINLKTPKPIDYNRHVIVMEYLRGKELAYYKDIDDPEYIFQEIIKQMRLIYQKADLIHGDMGEFNIVADKDGNILIIDWLQSVSADHPNAIRILRRDIKNICDYFRKKYHIECDTGEILESFLKE
ncbi:MAG: RIO-type serine/threonine-protein kinase Rio2 [Promethearchaeota archaeon]|jgi:RIO kinase 2|nr:MAG: RIO-type serine/threonine-protein kinase Rio2 [Candidatus Lokiarchaeota archaeon]